MATVSTSFTSVTTSSALVVRQGDAFTYSVSGTFVGTVWLQESKDAGSTWQNVLTAMTAAASGTFVARGTQRQDMRYRLNCTAYTSGTIVTALADVERTESVLTNSRGTTLVNLKEESVEVPSGISFSAVTGTVTTLTSTTAGITTATVTNPLITAGNVGAKNGATVTAVEYGDGVVHQTVLTLASTPVPVVSVTSGAGVGGYKIYDMPAGHIVRLGCTADLSLAIATAKQADFTDATPEGDLGIGTVAPANADALGTDATDDDWGTAVAFTCDAYAVAQIKVATEAVGIQDGSTTAKDIYVNALVDAGDIADDTTSEVLVSGTVKLTWINLGTYAA